MFKLFKNLFKSKNIGAITTSLRNSSVISGFGSSTVIWNTLQNDIALLDVFRQLSEVYAPISWQANQASKVKFKLLKTNSDETKEEIKEHEIIDLLNNPNSQQGWNEFLRQLIASFKLFGNAYVNALLPDLKNTKPTKLFLLPSQYTQIRLRKTDSAGKNISNDDFRFSKVAKYIISTLNIEIDPEQVLHLKDINLSFSGGSNLYGMSSLLSSQKPITSLDSAYNAKVNLYQNGPRVVMTGNNTSDYLAPTAGNIEEVQERFKKYGLLDSQYQFLITEHPLSVNVISNKVADLQITQNNEADLRAICNTQNLSSIIFNDNSSSTFSNKKEAMKNAWEGTIKATVDSIIFDFGNWLIKSWWSDEKLTLEPDYSSIPELQTDINEMHNRLVEAVKIGAITRQEYRMNMGFDLDETNQELNEYYSLGAWSKVEENNQNDT